MAVPAPRQTSLGHTLVEMSVVLIIIAVIIGAVTVGNDVLRHANGQRIFSQFVTGWRDAYSRYVSLTNVVPGDDPLAPTYRVRGAVDRALCNDPGASLLSDTFLRRGVALPSGHAAGQEDRFVYQDSNGSPHELRVCFVTVIWSVPGNASGVYIPAERHVMRITRLTSELAMQLDTLIDGRLDARFGRFREVGEAARLSPTGVDWSPVKLGAGEDNIQEVQAYLEMN